jgi:hypothetical protein
MQGIQQRSIDFLFIFALAKGRERERDGIGVAKKVLPLLHTSAKARSLAKDMIFLLATIVCLTALVACIDLAGLYLNLCIAYMQQNVNSQTKCH